MSSQIENIYTAIKAFAPTYDSDATITVRDVDELKDMRLEIGPIRMLFLPEDTAQEFVAMGNPFKNVWRINDRLYYGKTGGGGGIATANDNIRKYIASYMDAVRSNRGLGASVTQSHIIGAEYTPRNDLTYGADDTNWYGVDVLLTIEEFVT